MAAAAEAAAAEAAAAEAAAAEAAAAEASAPGEALAAAEDDAPMTAEEARRAAHDEGLELITAPESKTGYRSVYKIDRKRPYQAWSAGAKRNARSLGCFATVEEAALAHARSVDRARRADEGGGLLDPGPKAAAAQQGAAAVAPGAAGAAGAPTAASGGAWEAKRRGRSAAPEWQLAEAAAEPEAKRRCVSVSAVAPGSLSSAATDAKRRRRATGSELASPVQRDPLFARRAAAPEQSGQRHATDVGSYEV